MPGFYITNLTPIAPICDIETKCLTDHMEADSYHIWRITRQRYLDDKLFFQNEKYVVILEGVILNKRELLEQHQKKSLQELVLELLEEDPKQFYDRFRGMFSGAIYFRSQKSWLVFVDHLSNKALYYYVKDGKIIVGSTVEYVAETMKKNGISRTVDPNGILQSLAYSGFLDESTGISEIKRLMPCDYAWISDGGASTHTYHVFSEEENTDLSNEEAIDLLNGAFRRAVKLALDKDREYGYTSIVDISGGADSRMIAYTVDALGGNDSIGCHYSQSRSNDATISQEIAKKLELEFYGSNLDDAKFLKDVDMDVRMNSGAALYSGFTGGRRMLEGLSGKNVGLEFTGLLGNMVDGGMLTKGGDEAPTLAHENFVCDPTVDRSRLKVNTLTRFKTNDMFWQYVRGMLLGMNTFLIRQYYVEPYTPYGDVEFMQAWLSIPWKQKVENKLLLRWMDREFPEAMKISYATRERPLSVDLSPFEPFWKYYYYGKVVLKRKLLKKDATNMNPFIKWEQEKPWLLEWIRDYYHDGMSRLKDSGKLDDALLGMIDKTYHSSKFAGKYVALTVVSFCKQFLID